MLMKWLKEAGVGFDCASGMELEKAAVLFHTPSAFASSTVFANPCKPPRDLATAMRLQSGPTVVDSVEEVQKLTAMNWKQGSLIRIAVDDQGSKMPFSKKFGAAVADIPAIQTIARSLGQEIKGISFHVGSGCQDLTQYSKAIQLALLSLAPSKGPKIVDLGGGFETETFHKAAKCIQESIKAVPSTLPIQWIAEPGRFMASDFQDLFVPVIGKKAGSNGWRYTIDESLYGQFSSIPFDRATPKWLRIQSEGEITARAPSRKRMPGVLFGRTCDSVDMIAQSDDMEELEVGDWLWFPKMGAYTSVTATEFNGFPKPKVIYTEESQPHPMFMGFEPWPTKIKTVSHVTVPQ
jgi:ornithine decarboxylase